MADKVRVGRFDSKNSLKSSLIQSTILSKFIGIKDADSRKGLQTLQPSASNCGILVGKNRTVHSPSRSKKRKLDGSCQDKATKVRKLRPKKGDVKVFSDETNMLSEQNTCIQPDKPNTQLNEQDTQPDEQCVTTVDISQKTQDSTGDTISREAYDLMVNEQVPEAYWQDVAEERRVALVEALEENEQLHEEVKCLKEENKSLSEMASQAEYFASMLKNLTEENTATDDDDNNSFVISDEPNASAIDITNITSNDLNDTGGDSDATKDETIEL